MSDSRKEVFTSREAANYLQIHRNTLRKLTKSGEIPARKVGRQWRYHKDALDNWLKGKNGGDMEFKRTLREKNVTVIDESRIHLECNSCGQRWSPNILRGGRNPNGYWKCPNGCNTEED